MRPSRRVSLSSLAIFATLALAAVLSAVAGLAAEPVFNTWTVDGVERSAIVVVPETKEGEKLPVVFVFHGHGGSGRQIGRSRFETHWPEAIVVYPNGLPTKSYYDPEGKRAGWQATPGDQNDRDLKFFDAMLKSLREQHPGRRRANLRHRAQ